VADQVRDVLDGHAVSAEHAHERVPQFAGRPFLPEVRGLAYGVEVAADVSGAAGRAGGAGEETSCSFQRVLARRRSAACVTGAP